MTDPHHLSWAPRFPAGTNFGVAVIGCGSIVREAHLPAYAKYGVNVVGAYDIAPEVVALARSVWPFPKAYDALDALLADPAVHIVDIATHPAERVALIERALSAGKHVLSQKPFAPSLAGARYLAQLAEARQLKLAVNQNGRWNPPWRVSTQLVEGGWLGDVTAVTHIFDTSFAWITQRVFNTVPHWAIYDYAIHWIDITTCWLGAKTPVAVRAREYRLAQQPQASIAPWGMWIEIEYADGSSALIRAAGDAKTTRGGHPFWIHGASGTVRGSAGQDFVTWEDVAGERGTFHYPLSGSWFPDGFGGTMGELQCAIAEDRAPSNSARNNLLTLELTLAACASAERDGAPVRLASATNA